MRCRTRDICRAACVQAARLCEGFSVTAPRQIFRIGLLWHSMNAGNLGIGPLTVSDIAIVEAVAKRVGRMSHFTVIGWTDGSED